MLAFFVHVLRNGIAHHCLADARGSMEQKHHTAAAASCRSTSINEDERRLMSQHSLGRKPITNPAATPAAAATRYQTEQPGRRVSSEKYRTCTAVRLEQLAHFLVRRKVLHRFHDQRLLLRRQHHVLEVNLRREVLQCGACIRVNLTWCPAG